MIFFITLKTRTATDPFSREVASESSMVPWAVSARALTGAMGPCYDRCFSCADVSGSPSSHYSDGSRI